MPRRKHFEWGIFHGSEHEPEHFLKAPLIHVGSWDSAIAAVDPQQTRYDLDDFGNDNIEEVESKVHSFGLSPTAQVHRVTVPDKIANEAHAHYLQQMGLPVPETVAFSRSYHGKNHPLVKSTLRALNAGKIVPYVNDYEMARDSEGWALPNYDDSGNEIDEPEISYMVPLPKLNLTQFK